MTPKWKVAYALSSLLLLVGPAPAHSAAVAGDASGFVATLGSQATYIMRDAELSVADRQQRFRVLMQEDFDLPTIARSVLGRYWQEISNTERQQFTNAFADYMARVYSTRFANYSAGSFHVLKQHAESGTISVVSTEITRLSTKQPIKVDWCVAKTADGYKVTDITVDGASLSRVQREEFSSAIQRSGGSVSSLIQELPELYAGLHRSAANFPVQYPGANVPQAWAAGSVFSMVQAILGFQPDAPHKMLYVDPVLPPWLDDLTVTDLRIGEKVFDIRFWRSGGETRFDVLKGDPASVAHREMVVWSDLLKRNVHETVA